MRPCLRSRRGFTVVELGIVLTLGILIAAICLPNLIQSRKHGNEASCIGALKTICTSESVFREGDEEHDGNLDYGMLSELERAGLVDELLGSGTKRGYAFRASYSVITSEFLWFATAGPVLPTVTGDRYWATNQAGVLFYTSGASIPHDPTICALPNHGVVPS